MNILLCTSFLGTNEYKILSKLYQVGKEKVELWYPYTAHPVRRAQRRVFPAREPLLEEH